MSMVATYADPAVFTASPWSEDVSGALRVGSITGLIDRAELGSSGISNIVLDDPDATLGHSADAILGLKQIWIDETDCPAGDQRVFTGFIGDRTYRRGDSLITGAARKIDVTLIDANEILTERIMHLGFGADPAQPCDRPAETDFERIAWLLITGYTRAVFDLGLVAKTGPVNMDACNYEGQKPADILNDCSQQSGRNHFIYFDEASGTFGLFYDFNSAAVYSSSLQISNVLTDVDNVTTFAPETDAELTRDPSRVSAGVYMPFDGGTTYQENLPTAVTYAFRDAAAPSSNVKTLANANIRALRYLNENATEEDKITCTVRLPAAKVTGIKAGHRIQAKFSHLPGMTNYVWCRITARTVKQDETTAEFYNVGLEMSPEPVAMTCSESIAAAIFAADAEVTAPGVVPFAYPSISITPTPGLAAVVFGALFTLGGADTPWTLGAGWTTLGSGKSQAGHEFLGTMYQAVPNPSGASTPNGILTKGGYSWDPIPPYLMIAASIASASTSPIQSGFEAFATAENYPFITFAPPTLGNVIVMIATCRTSDFGALIPATGWTLVVKSPPGVMNSGRVAIWMRCADPAAGNDYGFAPVSLEYNVSVSEWTP